MQVIFPTICLNCARKYNSKKKTTKKMNDSDSDEEKQTEQYVKCQDLPPFLNQQRKTI